MLHKLTKWLILRLTMNESRLSKRKSTSTGEKSENKLEKLSADCLELDVSVAVNEDFTNGGDSKTVQHITICQSLPAISHVKWKEIRGDNLVCDYCLRYDKTEADKLLHECESTLSYNEGQLARVNIFGKWHDIPRKQVAHGDPGLTYKFSNNTIPARPWTPLLEGIRNRITALTGYDFNFVLVNRYKDGKDHMGEHKDDEKDLICGYPIASLSLGQHRYFIFKHGDARNKKTQRSIDTVVVNLEHGSLLLMKDPTNKYWYHSLPQRKRLTGVRINMTFRKMVV